jgi:hypothetical protein
MSTLSFLFFIIRAGNYKSNLIPRRIRMSIAITYDEIPALDLAKARQQIAFPVTRETQLAENTKFISGFNRISVQNIQVPNGLIPIGEVPVNRPYLPYAETMDWMIEEFQEIGIPFKLRTSVIDKKSYGLYQEYIFDQPVLPPDGEGIAPMVLVHASYTKGSPLSLFLGTYRFVCSNGAIVSAGDRTGISVNSRNWGDLSARGFHDDFKDAFDHYTDVSKFYARLNSVPLSETAGEIFTPKLIPFCIRKKIVGQLEEIDAVSVNITTDKPDGEKFKALREEDLLNPAMVSVNSDISTWDVYNRFTSIGSKLSSSNRILIASKSIDRVFRRLQAAA